MDGRPTELPTYKDVRTAAARLTDVAHVTPVMTSGEADRRSGARLFFKMESLQRVGAFKFRGAYNAIAQLTLAQRRAGVFAFSSGNHAQAVALASRLLDIPATIVMPADAPAAKLAATRDYGARVVLYDRDLDDREAVARQLMADTDAVLIHPFNDPAIIAGQGTAAAELIAQVGRLDYLFVPVGGGGLISGSALSAQALSPGCRVVGVEPSAGDDAARSLAKGEIVSIPPPRTIADGAQVQRIGDLTFRIMQALVHRMTTANDERLRDQMRFFLERMKQLVEPTGCLAAAAAMTEAEPGARIGVIISGGNVDVEAASGGLSSASTAKVGIG